MPVNQAEALKEVLRNCRKSPLYFIERCWGLTPADNDFFIKGKNLTWQQAKVLKAFEDALAGKASRRISVASGNGIGKTALASWIILWFLLSFREAQIAVTAPSQDQLFDVLWKEAKKWINAMPPQLGAFYEWQQTHIRMKPSPETWFARAKTARKETPEALSGMHGESVLLIAEEASGIDNLIFETAEGVLTSPNVLVLIISNPTRAEGYFYDTHHKFKDQWQTFQFSSIDSPVVDKEFVSIKAGYGVDSDEYKTFVLGEFPSSDQMDDKGFIPLLSRADLKEVPDESRFGNQSIMGVDPSGEGKNDTVWVLRDQFRAKVVAKESISNPRSIAEKTITLMEHYGVKQSNVYIDNFGVGANVAQEIALSGSRYRVNAVQVGEKATNDKNYLNRRAEAYLSLREWLRTGGELVRHDKWKQLLDIRYKRELSGKVRIISKKELMERGIKSPDVADALSLTFLGGLTHTSNWTTHKEMSDNEINELSNVYQ